MPSTLPRSLVIPAMFLADPFGLASPVTSPSGVQYLNATWPFGLQAVERVRVGVVVALAVRDRYAQHLAVRARPGERARCSLDAEIHPLAPELQVRVPRQDARQQPGLAQDLEPVAYPDDQAAVGGELLHGLHHGREARQRPGPQVVAVGETARQDDAVVGRQVGLLVPDVLDRLVQHLVDHVIAVGVAPGAREYGRCRTSWGWLGGKRCQPLWPRRSSDAIRFTSRPSARPRTLGITAPITLPMSWGPTAPTCSIAPRTISSQLVAAELLGQVLHDDGELGPLLLHEVVALSLLERLYRIPALLRLPAQELDRRRRRQARCATRSPGCVSPTAAFE